MNNYVRILNKLTQIIRIMKGTDIIRQLITAGEIDDAFNVLEVVTKETQLYEDTEALQKEYHQIEEDYMMGLMMYEEMSVKRNKLLVKLLNLCTEIKTQKIPSNQDEIALEPYIKLLERYEQEKLKAEISQRNINILIIIIIVVVTINAISIVWQ